jgi:hypothetical protein
MKILRILFLCTLGMLPAVALADNRPENKSENKSDDKTPDNSLVAREVGFVEGTLSVCVQVNPQGTDKYEQQRKLLLRGLGEVEAVRRTTEYRQAFTNIRSQLATVPKTQVAAACTGFLAGASRK